MARLCELADIIRGVTFDKEEATDLPGSNLIPILRAGNIQETLLLDQGLVFVPQLRVSQDQMLRNGDIAICMSSGSIEIVGKTAVIEHDWNGSVGAFCAIIRPRNGAAVPGYVAAWLRSPVFRQWTRRADGLNIKNIRRSELGQLEVQLPSEDEQRRIVDILDRATGIRRLRRQAQETARQIVPALFNKMFGDPGTNPMGWTVQPLGKLGSLERGRSRHRPRNEPSLLGGPYPLVQTGDVASADWFIRTFKSTYSEIGLQQSRLWPSGTLCITIAANIANSAILNFDACFPDSVVGFTPSRYVSTFYAKACLDFLREGIERLAPQLAQKNINLEILSQIPIPVPPISLQEDFAKRVEAVTRLVDRQTAAETICYTAEQAVQSRLLG